MVGALGIPQMGHIVKYRGIPYDWGNSKRQMFTSVLQRVSMKLEGWKEHIVSKRGKEILLKSLVQALPHYVISILSRPEPRARTHPLVVD